MTLRQPRLHRGRLAAVVLGSTLGLMAFSGPTLAQQGFQELALGFIAFERSRERCHYEPEVGQALARFDQTLAASSQGWRWRATLEKARQDAPLTLGFADTLTSLAPGRGPAPSWCAAQGLLLMQTLVSMMFTGGASFDGVVGRELTRLTNGGGREKGTPAPAAGSPETPPDASPEQQRTWTVTPHVWPDSARSRSSSNPPATPALSGQLSALRPFAGLWAKSDAECLDEEGPNSRTLVELDDAKTGPLFDRYENHCTIDRVAAGNPLQLTMTCYEFWENFTKRQEGEQRQAYITPMANGSIKINGENFQRCSKRAAQAAPAPSKPVTCTASNFCGVRPNTQPWACPEPTNLTLLTDEAKRAARCRPAAPYYIGEVSRIDNGIATIPMKYTLPGFRNEMFVFASSLQKVELDTIPTPTSRGWCRPGTWCVTSAASLFCSDRAAYDRVLAAPSGEGRRTAIAAEDSCRLVGPGHPMRPAGLPATGDPHRVIEVEHPILRRGWSMAAAFKDVNYNPPVTVTTRIGDFVVSGGKAPSYRAVSLVSQGGDKASAVLRSGPAERQEFCRTYHGREDTSGYRDCVQQQDETVRLRADCRSKRLWVDDRAYELKERPTNSAADLHWDRSRHWLFQVTRGGEWLDGSSASGEATVSSAFDVVCPAVNPEASAALIYRP